MKLDIATISFILCTTRIIQVIGIYFQARLNKSFDGAKYWVLGNLFNAIGVLLILIRPLILNNFIAIILPNMLIIVAQILIYIGIALFLNKEVKIKVIFTTFLITTISFIYLTYINNNINWRTIISSIAMATNSFFIAFELLRYKKNSIRNSVTFLGEVLIFYGIFYIIRSISVLSLNNMNSIFDASIMQASVFVISISVSCLSSFGLIIMVNQRVSAEEKEAQKRFQLIFEISPDAINISNLENGFIIEANDKFALATGYNKEELIGKTTISLGLWKDLKERERFVEILKKDGFCENFELGLRKKDGTTFIGLNSSKIMDFNGEKYVLNLIRDISERKRLENELKRQARIDGLTGISNRRHFMERVENELIRNKRCSKENAFLMLDIDYFKKVNDNFGHAIGDIAIKMLADVCVGTIRKTDIVGRIGGEEFAILLVQTNYTDAIEIAERLRLNVENIKLFGDNGVQVNLRISIGMTKCNSEEDFLEDLMIRSDKALYRAKNEGRNRVVSID